MQNLEKFLDYDLGDYHFNEPLTNHTTWKIGGPADLLIEPASIEQITQIIKITNAEKIPLVVIGNGSNLLFHDKGVRGVVVKLGNKFSRFSIKGTSVIAQAGIYVPELVRILAREGLSGLEHAAGIPGSLGGLVYMNGGSQNKAISDNVDEVWVLDENGRYFRILKEECNFSYRKSIFQKLNLIICSVILNLKKNEPDSIQKEIDNILSLREKKIPLNLPSCGSVFLRNSISELNSIPPGKLIEDAGLKGYQIGGAQVSHKHANFIENTGAATAKDVIHLVRYVKRIVSTTYPYTLKCEVRYIDENGTIKNLDKV